MPSQAKPEASAASAEDDVSMDDAPTPAPAVEEPALEPRRDNLPERHRIRELPGGTTDAASFEFKKEDHTLGNALRYIIMKNPKVEFCGYSIPHPSEALMNVRIQTYEGSAVEALEKGLDDLIDLCDVVASKFGDARTEYNNRMET